MIEQRSEAWFEARKGRVTASLVGAILNHSPYMTRAQAMRSMVRDACNAEREFKGNAATEWGTAMEPMAIGEFEDRTGLVVEKAGFITRDDWAGCSPDGLIGETAGLETKCPYGIRSDPAPLFKSLAEQPHYYDQVQFSMWVTGRDTWHFEQWTPYDHAGATVTTDLAWQNDNIPALRQFYAEFLYEMQENREEHLTALRREVDTPQAHKMVTEWDELSEAIERATERKADLLKEMVSLCGDNDALFAGRKLTKVEKEGSVSYAKALKALCPGADVEPYRGKPSSHWRLS